MGERIAMGFHTCVDYELVWDTQVVEERIRALGIQERELRMDIEMDSERAVWIACLAHLKEGIGGEMVPDTAEICERFAGHFGYSVTLGGTPTRAAIILDRLGYDTALQTSCYNEHVERLMPARVHVLPGVDAGHDEIYPHIVLQCRGGVRIHAHPGTERADYLSQKADGTAGEKGFEHFIRQIVSGCNLFDIVIVLLLLLFTCIHRGSLLFASLFLYRFPELFFYTRQNWKSFSKAGNTYFFMEQEQ